ncbi:DUF3631 domain-containing protein [Kitasatospora sp. CM 4170]|uniref:DUF3631 domain-containing protein n=1 Tax=Kitasatospora aburaviensis TaxID=67265 RepID=A0ABW1F0I8_9ACTN|nr:DUF3631 domain-containing protein [Kitasatospora sp. CM 4170]WNM47336.1 DUF3631 domain-containing protein [Kitasatospora sp. CM 4170]
MSPVPAVAAWPPVAEPGQPGVQPHAEPLPESTACGEPIAADPVAEGLPGVDPVPDEPQSPGAALLEELHAHICRYAVLPSPGAVDAVTLWAAATHLQAVWHHAPRLAIVAPARRCGKSRLLDILVETVYDPLITVNTSASAIYRTIAERPRTLLIDEVDTIFGNPRAAEKYEDLRGLLNAGHQRNRPVTRSAGNDHQSREFSTFAMAALAGIGDLPGTIMDRSIVIRMRRRADGEVVAPLRDRRDGVLLRETRDKLSRWALEVSEEARALRPDMPVEDRAADTWEPLVAVADLAGGSWPRRARQACVAMVAAEAEIEEDSCGGARILADVRRIFFSHGDPAILPTTAILAALNDDPEAPWAEHGRGGLSARALAGLLKDYQISSSNIRLPDGTQRKGYTFNKFADSWRRYCPKVHPLPPRASAVAA